jgi:hypothetical protein
MKQLPWDHIERFRLAGVQGDDCGAFQVPHNPTNVNLRIIVSSGMGWEHVSVSLPNRTPNWREMEFVCRLFWSDDEAVMQLHPPRSDWISNHPHCLHMWRPSDGRVPLPPSWMVGSKALGELDQSKASDRALACFAAETALAQIKQGDGA